MSETINKEILSFLKWLSIIIICAVIYNNFSKPFYFTKQGDSLLRGNIHTGRMEYLDEYEWVDVTESLIARSFREKRKEKVQESFNRMVKDGLLKKD